jgi:hypothetical protein
LKAFVLSLLRLVFEQKPIMKCAMSTMRFARPCAILDGIEYKLGVFQGVPVAVISVASGDDFHVVPSITFQDMSHSVIGIGTNGFIDSRLSLITIPALLTGSFRRTKIEKVSFAVESWIDSISLDCFKGIRLASIVIASCVKTISESAFSGC